MSLLFPFILFAMLFIIYTGFYVHNRAIAEEAAYEAAIYGSSLDNTDLNKVQKQVEQRLEGIMEDRLFSVQDKSLSVQANKERVQVEITIKMKSWNFLSIFEGYISSRNIQYSESAEYIYPKRMLYIAEIIQKF